VLTASVLKPFDGTREEWAAARSEAFKQYFSSKCEANLIKAVACTVAPNKTAVDGFGWFMAWYEEAERSGFCNGGTVIYRLKQRWSIRFLFWASQKLNPQVKADYQIATAQITSGADSAAATTEQNT
jgi:hypothetical protein